MGNDEVELLRGVMVAEQYRCDKRRAKNGV